MNDTLASRPPVWFRVVAVLALLWNLFGVWQYLSSVGVVPLMRELTADEAAIMASAPAWYTGAFAIAANTRADFARALREKMVLEISGLAPRREGDLAQRSR